MERVPDIATTDRGAERRGRRRALWPLGVLATAGLAVGLVLAATGSAALPTVITPGQGVAVVAGRLVDVRLHDINGRVVRLPDGRPGVILFIDTHNCGVCVRAAAALGALRRRLGRRVGAFAISESLGDDRSDFVAFGRRAGNPPIHYGLDTTLNGAANLLGPPDLDGAIIYDARGQIVDRLGEVTSVRQLSRALHAGRSGP